MTKQYEELQKQIEKVLPTFGNEKPVGVEKKVEEMINLRRMFLEQRHLLTHEEHSRVHYDLSQLDSLYRDEIELRLIKRK